MKELDYALPFSPDNIPAVIWKHPLLKYNESLNGKKTVNKVIYVLPFQKRSLSTAI